MGLPLLQAREPEFGLVLLWLLFILIPIVGRIVGWILRRLSPGGTASGDPGAAREERKRQAREIQRQGEELFRRLLGGDEPEEERASTEREASRPPAAPATPVTREASGAPASARPSSAERRSSASPPRRRTRPEPRRPQIAEPLRREPSTLPSEQRLPSRREDLPSSVVADAFDDDLVGLDIDLTGLGEDLESGDFVSARSSEGGGMAFALSDRADLVRAIVWSEILGPPVSQREPGLPGGG